MSDLETINGKTYQKIPVELNGIVVKFVLVEVPSTPAAPVVAETEPAALASEESEEVDSDVPQEAEIVEETTEAVEIASDATPLEFQAEVVEDEEEEIQPTLVSSPIEPQKTVEIDSCVEDEDSDTRSESSTGSSTIDSSVDLDEEFPSLDGKVDSKTEKDAPFTRQNLNRLDDRQPVCYKPTYKTLQKIQVRTGPGSKFDASGVIPANAQVFVIQEGLLSCGMELVVEWMSLHLPKDMVREELIRSSAQNFDEYIERALILDSLKEYTSTLEAFAKLTYTKADQKEFLKAAKAANRKVKVMWVENGVEQCGWISKRKNNKSDDGKKTKPLITRVMGATSTPKVEVFNIKADIPRFVQRQDCSFAKDAWYYKENSQRKVPSRYFEGETDTVHCFPPMSFYTNLAKSEIAKIIGSKRFNISWEGDFKLDRYRGLEKKRVVCHDGKTRLRNGYHVPNNYMTITFQRYSDANALLKADFDETRFSGAVAEACGIYANLRPVPATMCQEYVDYETAVC